MDNPDWRAKITSILNTASLGGSNEEIIGFVDISSGKISGKAGKSYAALGFWTWTIKATGYPDTIVTVEVRP